MANEVIAGADKLKKRILMAAGAEVEKIRKETEQECAAIEDAYKKEEKQAKAKLTKQREDAVKAILERSRTNAELQSRKDALLARRKVLDKVFEKTYEELAVKNPDNRAKILGKLLRREALGGETIVCSKADKEKMQKHCEMVSDELVKAGKKPLAFSKDTADIDYGFIIMGDGYEKDCSLRALIEDVWESEETGVAKILFN